jgi:hypothetical protein
VGSFVRWLDHSEEDQRRVREMLFTDGYLYAFNAAGCGQITCVGLWDAAGRAIARAPAISEGRVFVRDRNRPRLRPPQRTAPAFTIGWWRTSAGPRSRPGLVTRQPLLLTTRLGRVEARILSSPVTGP